MRLYEFDNVDPIINKIVVAVNQLKDDIRKQGIDLEWDVDTLLSYFKKYGVLLDVSDLYLMIDKHPLKSIISNIKGDKVIFKGKSDSNTDMPKDEDNKIVKQMANKALKK